MNMKILPLSTEHVDDVITLIKSGMDPYLFSLMIYACPGYKNYVNSIVNVPYQYSNCIFFGAFIEEKLAGFLECRLTKNTLHYNNLFISPEIRGSGIGKELMKRGCKLAKEQDISHLTCDVFDQNVTTKAWKERTGFQVTEKTYWFMGKNPYNTNSSENISFKLKNYPQTEVAQKTYNFSLLEIETTNGEYTIGLVNDQYLRITDIKCLQDSDLLKALSIIEPNRTLLVLSPSPDIQSLPNLKFICSNSRFKCLLTEYQYYKEVS